MTKNRVKAKLQAGDWVVGSGVSIPDPFAAEVMGSGELDFIFVDTEHSPMSINQVQNVLIALRSSGSSLIVRVPGHDPVSVKHVLDMGADGVVIPDVSSAEECRLAVASARYPPEGIRGFGPRRAGRLAESRAEYARHANDEVIVLVMIEQLEAIERIDEILATPGLDGIMVGPGDLAVSMGYLNDMNNPAVEDVIEVILKACQRNSIPFGMYTGTADKARRWIGMGCQIATIGQDVQYLDAGIAKTKKEILEIRDGTAT